MKKLSDNSIDLIATDPPYGIKFMNRAWDKAIPSVEIWKECLRIMKPGSFAFVMCIPRQDCLSRMIISLEDAGFNVNFSSIYWTFASGFPKASNIGKLADKRGGRPPQEYRAFASYIKEKRIRLGLSMKDIAKYFLSKTSGITGCVWNWENGANVPTKQQMIILRKVLKLDNRFDELIERAEAEREITSKGKPHISGEGNDNSWNSGYKLDYTRKDKPATSQAKALDGSYGGFQMKPAVEVVLVAMKPLSEKTYVDQALNNRKGITWQDNCRIPYESNVSSRNWTENRKCKVKGGFGFKGEQGTEMKGGRFPANLICGSGIDINIEALLEAKNKL